MGYCTDELRRTSVLFIAPLYHIRQITPVLDRKKRAQFWFVKAHDDVLVNCNDRYAHLPAFFYHLFSFGKIGRDIVFGKRHFVGIKKFLRRVAKVAGRGRGN